MSLIQRLDAHTELHFRWWGLRPGYGGYGDGHGGLFSHNLYIGRR